MTTKISTETRRILQGFLEGRVSAGELDDWLTQSEYDSDLSLIERDALATIRLALIEASEGIAKKDSVAAQVKALLARDDQARAGARRTS